MSGARRMVGALSPANVAWAIPGPVFGKEAGVLSRKISTYWVRGLYALGLLGLVSLVFIGAASDIRSSSASHRLQRMQVLAPMVSMTILWFQFVLLPICAAAMCSGAICEEHRKGTLAALLTTPLRSWQILLGKVAGAFVQLVILALIATPLLLAVRVFGGVRVEAIVSALVLTISTSLLAAILAAWSSIYSTRAATSLLQSLMLLLFVQFGPALLYAILAHYKLTNSGPWFVLFSTPIAMGFSTAELVMGNGSIPFPTRYAVMSSSGYTLGWAVVVFIGASLHLRRWLRRYGSGEGKGAAQVGATQAQGTAKKAGRSARRGSNSQSRMVGDEPVLWRETRQSAFKTRKSLWLVTLFLSGCLAFIYWEVGFGERDMYPAIGVVFTILCVSMAAVATTSGINGERESRTWDPLLCTPLSARAIVVGKFMGAMRRQWFLPTAFGAHCAVCIATGGLSPIILLHIPLLLLPTMAAQSALGLFLSSICRRSSVAAVLNFGIALFAWALILMIVGMTFEMALGGGGDKAVSVIALMNPVGMIAVSFLGASNSQAASPYELYDLERVGAAAFTVIAALYCAGYGVLTALLLEACTQRIRAESGRAK